MSASGTRRCANCGEENPARARFCLACGEALAAPAPQAEERKVVTVLFCDLVGFTARSDRADPEDVRAALRPYHTLLRREIERFGGTVEKFIGDAVMAVFGAPVAHEDDAERAVRAALRITEAIGELNEQQAGLELAVRVGLNTGEAVVALGARPEQGEGIVTGDVVNTASRLQGVAPVGGIAVGEPTYRATREIFDYEQLEPVQVKGKADPLAVWLGKSARGRYGVDVDQDKPTPLIGRDDDLALLKQTYARAIRDSSIQLVTVTGEPGVGKTRLLAEFRTFVDDQPELVYWRQGRCLPYGEGITFWALGEIVKAHTGILDSDRPDEAGTKLDETVAAAVEEISEREWFRSRLAPLVGLPAAEDGTAPSQEESFAAWRRFLEGIAVQRPLVLVFEDLHWADDAMLGFVDHLVDWADAVPLLVICTARPELFDLHVGWGGGKRNSTTVSLAPLSEEDTARLIAALLEQAVLPADTQAALLERAGGNPLYAEEFVKMLTDRGILQRRGRAWVVSLESQVPVPESVAALIAARLDTLPPERKALLQDASVVGKVFWTGAVASMGGVDEEEVKSSLHELARKELVRSARRSSVKDQLEYSFWHLLVRDVAYGQIPRAARASKHGAAAAWIEEMAGERVADHAEVLAYHYGEALNLVTAAGEAADVQALTDAARRFLILAGDHTAGLDQGKAETYYRRALALTPPGTAGRGRLLAKLAEAGWYSSRLDPDEADALFAEAIEELRDSGEVMAAGEAMVRRYHPLWAKGETVRARAVIEEAIAFLEPEGPTPELAAAYTSLTGRLMIGGEEEAALEMAERSIALATEVGAENEVARTLQYRGMARLVQGDNRGYDDLRESLRRCLELGLAYPAASGYNNLADWITEEEGFARSYEMYQTAIQYSLSHGMPGAARWSRMEATFRLYEMGRWDELLEEEDQLIESDRAEGGGGQITVHAEAFKALTLAARGRSDDAAELIADALPRARSIADLQPMWAALRSAAVIEHLRGNRAVAARLAHELHDVFGGSYYTPMLPEATRILVAAGEVESAADLVTRAETPYTTWKVAKATGEAVVLEATGSFEDAIGLYLDVAERWVGFGGVLERAYALLGAGRCLLALGRRVEATTELTAARDIWASLGARPLLDDVDKLLAEATALTS